MFAGVPVKLVEHSEPVRGRGEYTGLATGDGGQIPKGTLGAEVAITDATTREWVEACCNPLLTDIEAREAMGSGLASLHYEVSSRSVRSADNSIAMVKPIEYQYTGAAQTQLHETYAGHHVIARPTVNKTVVDAMYKWPSADKFVTATGMKLPRQVADQSTRTGVPGISDGGRGPTAREANTNVSAQFEATRREVSQLAKSDDYGRRLFNLARVVLHARVAHTLGVKPEETPAMGAKGMRFMLANETPHLTIRQLHANVYLYVHTDDTADYRAFLTMGVRGVHNYVGAITTIYSECRVAVEADESQGGDIVFVRIGGDYTVQDPGITNSTYMRVLANPDACMAYYYAYARSMGLGEIATAILCQAAVGPHVWGPDAVSPYKNSRPKLDAAAYCILPSEDDAHVALTDTRGLVHNAAIIAKAVMAGMGAVCMSFKAGKDVNSQEVMRQTIERLADPETRRGLVRAVTSRYSGGNVGLEWLSPFSYDVTAGLQSCVMAWRDTAVLLSLYRSTPLAGLVSVFSSGVDMKNAMIGRQVTKRENSYAQLVVGCLASGQPVPGRCERPAVAVVAHVNNVTIRLREWHPVVTYVRLTSVDGPTGKLADSPGRHRDASLQEETTTDLPSSMTSGGDSRSMPPDELVFHDDGESDNQSSPTPPVVTRRVSIGPRKPRVIARPLDVSSDTNGNGSRGMRPLRLSQSNIAPILQEIRKPPAGAVSDVDTRTTVTAKSVGSVSTAKPAKQGPAGSSGSSSHIGSTKTARTELLPTDKVTI